MKAMLDTMTRETNAAFVGSSEDMNEIPIWHKFNLTIEEAARYSNIGVNKIREIVSYPDCTFVLHVGRRKLIKRNKFEAYLEEEYSL